MADGIFNSAVLISGDGKIRMVQRKVSEKPPYATRQQVKIMQTKFGKVAILICGDLFDNETVQQVPPDTRMVIVPMARGFDRQSSDSKRWKNEERQAYQKDARSSNKNINRP
jgi:predicted amidohydrolase